MSSRITLRNAVKEAIGDIERGITEPGVVFTSPKSRLHITTKPRDERVKGSVTVRLDNGSPLQDDFNEIVEIVRELCPNKKLFSFENPTNDDPWIEFRV